MNAAVDFTEPLLAVDVVAILGAVAVGSRPRDDLDEFRPLDVEETREFCLSAAHNHAA